MSDVQRPSDTKRKVVVVGGGPAGMEASRLLSLKGNQVTLLEKDSTLGGTLFYAGSLSRLYVQNLKHLAKFQKSQLVKQGVDIQVNTEATAATLKALDPDVVIIAAGSKYTVPEGLSGDGDVLTLDEYLRSDKAIGKRVIVLGGLDGSEISVSLAREGKEVTLVHDGDTDSLGEAVYIHDPLRKNYLKEYLASEPNLKILTHAKLIKAENHEAHIETPEGTSIVGYDNIVAALERHQDRHLESQIEGLRAKVLWIGDCVRPGSVVGAIDDAWYIARDL